MRGVRKELESTAEGRFGVHDVSKLHVCARPVRCILGGRKYMELYSGCRRGRNSRDVAEVVCALATAGLRGKGGKHAQARTLQLLN